MLTGASGVGKSRLLEEFATRMAPRRSMVLLGRTAADAELRLGVFRAALAPDGSPATDPVDALSMVSLALGRFSRTVLGIDSLDQVDASSAGLVRHLLDAGATVVGTLVDGARLPEALRRLDTDGGIELVPVPPLVEAETGLLLRALLDGPVDHGAIHRLHTRSAGLPLVTQALAAAAVAGGRLRRERGIRVLFGELPPTSVGSAVAAQLAALASPVRAALTLICLAEPVELSIIETIAGPAAIHELDAQRLVRFDAATRRLSVAHPYYREAVLAETDLAAATAAYRALADAARGEPGAAIGLRRSHWRVLSGEEIPAAELLEFGAAAIADGDPRLADGFLDAAARCVREQPELLRLAALYSHQHRFDDTLGILDRTEAGPLDAAARIEAACARALLLVMPGHRPGAALELVDRLLAELGPVPILLALRSTALWRLARIGEAREQAAAVLHDLSAPVAARAHAGLAMVSASVNAADAHLVRREAAGLEAVCAAAASELPEGPESLRLVLTTVAVYLDDDSSAARARVARGYRDALLRGDDGVRAQYGQFMAQLELRDGRVAQGLALLDDVVAVAGMWNDTTRFWVGRLRVEALALAGRGDEASAAWEELDAAIHPPVDDAHLGIAHAVALAACGDRDSAAATALRTAAGAGRDGNHGFAEHAWFLAMRWGSDAAARTYLAAPPAPSTPLTTSLVATAHALLRDDPASLVAVGEALRGRGWHRHGADLLGLAVETAAAGARTPGPEVWGAFERALASRPELAGALMSTVASAVLSPRELAVARIVAAGADDAAAADALAVSVRTVQTHLSRVYRKLGIAGRPGLAGRLGHAAGVLGLSSGHAPSGYVIAS